MNRIIFVCLLFFISNSFRFNLNKDGAFTILQLTDLHFESKESTEQNKKILFDILNFTNPDLIVITGDTVSGYAYNPGDIDFFKNYWQEFVIPFEQLQKPYCYLQGNHDSQGDLSRVQIMQLDRTSNFSAYNSSYSIYNDTNFVIPIYDNDNQIAAALWMFDSGGYDCDNSPTSYGCVNQEQIAWFQSISQQLKKQSSNYISFAFQHIPPIEMMFQYNNYPVYAEKHEDVCCGNTNLGLVDNLIQDQNVKAIFVGHDHNNWYGGNYNGLEMIYGIKTGYGGYGPVSTQQHGARVIQIQKTTNNDYQYLHWEVYEDGSTRNITSYQIQSHQDQKQYTCCYGTNPEDVKKQKIINQGDKLIKIGLLIAVVGLVIVAIQKLKN